MQRIILTAALATATLLSAAATSAVAAPANSAPLTVQTRVVYSDLDLTTTAGAKTLLQRIKTAAEAGCGGSPFTRTQSLTAFDNFNACRDAAVKQAVAAMRAPMLTYVASGERGPAPNAYAGR